VLCSDSTVAEEKNESFDVGQQFDIRMGKQKIIEWLDYLQMLLLPGITPAATALGLTANKF